MELSGGDTLTLKKPSIKRVKSTTLILFAIHTSKVLLLNPWVIRSGIVFQSLSLREGKKS